MSYHAIKRRLKCLIGQLNYNHKISMHIIKKVSLLLNSLGLSYYLIPEYKKAIEMFDYVISKDNKHIDSYYSKGMVFYDL